MDLHLVRRRIERYRSQVVLVREDLLGTRAPQKVGIERNVQGV
ncbi:hypothetical protein [Sinorhizobium psoraleae]|uniref:Uncharacterized protein n=1 Tax=Sinorhizobium psoraleae TaxID=520838 RepID=A0ABT4KNA7_9HYPH|nr:hypothetical protein [Sinorhizobium psoraleae]MCZ4093445.1 hypothetical protein [Sinorhizobium psoraleae]